MQLCFGRRFAQVLLARQLICAASTALMFWRRDFGARACCRIAGSSKRPGKASPGLAGALAGRSAPEIGRLRQLPQPDGQRHHAHDGHGAAWVHRLPRRKRRNRGCRRAVAQGSAQYEEAKMQAHPRPRFAENARSSANPVRAYTRWLKEDRGIHQICEPRRFARGGANMRRRPAVMPRSAARAHQHDVARRDAVGCSALQQRRVPLKNPFLWRELWPGRDAAEIANLSAADGRRDAHQGSSSLSRTDRAVGGFAARQRAASIRTGRREETGSRKS